MLNQYLILRETHTTHPHIIRQDLIKAARMKSSWTIIEFWDWLPLQLSVISTWPTKTMPSQTIQIPILRIGPLPRGSSMMLHEHMLLCLTQHEGLTMINSTHRSFQGMML
jgi:hypothetical protein